MAKKKHGIKFYLPLAIVVLAVIAGVIYWYTEYRKYINTDDAHLEADKVAVSSRITARILKLYADEGDTVKAGMLLVELDSADLLAQRNQAHSQELFARASKVQAEAKYNYDQESLRVLQVDIDKAKEDYDRGKLQYDGQVITTEQFDHLKKALEAAQARLDAARAQLDVSRAQIGNADASVNTARAQVQVIETQLRYVRLYAPVSGIVARRWLLPGDMVQTGQPVMTLTDNHKLWVAAYLEETKMEGVHIGQAVKYTLDAFGNNEFEGKIYSIGSNTASQFSLIPPNNASGNFTKVTQRIPLKISIEKMNGDTAVSHLRLIAGMSAVIRIVR